MSYVLPQVLVFQDFQASPASQANPLRAHISGPHAQLVRFSDSDEQVLGGLGTYDNLSDAAFDWPNRAAGGVIDESYVKLFAKNAILRYFQETTGGGNSMTKTAGYRNRISSSSVNFKANGTSYPRDADLFDRDVKTGDIVKAVFKPVAEDPVTLWTYVTGFAADQSAAAVNFSSGDDTDPDNAANDTADGSFVQTHGPFNAVTITDVDGSAYDPRPTGQVTETYTLIVTQSSIGNNFATARIRVISASGLDDQEEITPSAEGQATDIGTHGAQVTFDDSGGATASDSATGEGFSPNDLIAGQRFVVTVTGNYTKPTVAASGTYVGTIDRVYVVEVVEGKKFADGDPKIKVTTTDGTDVSGPTPVTASAAITVVGTKGVRIAFTGVGLALGDRWYVHATAAADTDVRTLILGHNIPDTVNDGDSLDLDLYILKPTLEVSRNRIGFAPTVNFETTETQITVKSGIIAYDESWTDGGEPLALSLFGDATNAYGQLFVEYRAWLQTLCHEVGTIDDVANIDDAISGALHPDNPLKWAVFKALENSNGTEVKFTSVCDPDDVDSWIGVLELLDGRDEVYGLVPLTRTRTILDLYAAHVTAQSTPEQGLWRALWVNLAGVPTIPVVAASSTVPGHTTASTSDGEVCLATITDDETADEFTIVKSNNGQFAVNGVRAGDIVRAIFTDDGFGNESYSEFVVDAVSGENELRLVAGPDAAINIASKIEIWRNLTATEESAEIARDAGSWANRRIRAVWPDAIESSGTVQEGYFLCASLAGLRSGVVPHQGMTNLEIVGYTDVPRTTSKFNRAQLDAMAFAGTWIVTQDRVVGTIFTRHAVTTGANAIINEREEMFTSNSDSVSFRFKDYLKPYIGVTNVTPSTLDSMALEIRSLIEVLKTEKFSTRLGGQILDAVIVELRPHLTLQDRVVAVIDPVWPFPLNNMELHLVL